MPRPQLPVIPLPLPIEAFEAGSAEEAKRALACRRAALWCSG